MDDAQITYENRAWTSTEAKHSICRTTPDFPNSPPLLHLVLPTQNQPEKVKHVPQTNPLGCPASVLVPLQLPHATTLQSHQHHKPVSPH